MVMGEVECDKSVLAQQVELIQIAVMRGSSIEHLSSKDARANVFMCNSSHGDTRRVVEQRSDCS